MNIIYVHTCLKTKCILVRLLQLFKYDFLVVWGGGVIQAHSWRELPWMTLLLTRELKGNHVVVDIFVAISPPESPACGM